MIDDLCRQFAFSTFYKNRRIESSLSNPIADIKALGIESLIVRLDYNYNLDNLIKQIEICPCSVITNKTIPEDIILKYKSRIIELIYYLEKQDINEEQVRLNAHLDYFISTMETDFPNGKKLGFISQEIGREINTIGSKSSNAEMQKIQKFKKSL